MDRHAHLSDPKLYAAFYEAHGRVSEGGVMPIQEARLRWVLDWIGPNDDVIDIGCHKGEMTVHIWGKTAGRVVGLDIAQSAVTQASQDFNEEGLEFHQGDASAIPFPDDSFDVAVLSEILEHVPDPAVCLAEAERVVRDRGCVVISVPVNAIKMDQEGPDPHKSHLLGFDLDLHVREYKPELELKDKPNIKVAIGHQQTVDEAEHISDWYWRLAAYQNIKEQVAAA